MIYWLDRAMEGRGVEVDRMAPLHVNVESFHHRRPCGKTVSNRRCRRSIEPIAASSRVFFSTPSSLSSAQTPPTKKKRKYRDEASVLKDAQRGFELGRESSNVIGWNGAIIQPGSYCLLCFSYQHVCFEIPFDFDDGGIWLVAEECKEA